MQRDKLHISTVLMSLVLSVLVSYPAVMCLVDAFSLPCNRLQLFAVCGAAAVVSMAAMLPRRTWLSNLAAAVVYLAVLIWQQEALGESIQGFLFHVTSEYALCFDGVAVAGYETDCLVLLAALAAPLAWLTAWVVCREGNALFVLLACAPILVLCLVIVDVSPVFWLILLTSAFLLLLLTYSVRERSSTEGSRLAWWLLLPVTILVAGITVLWPPADYTRADWSQAMQVLAEQQFKLETISKQVFSDVPRWSSEVREVDLEAIGPKSMTGKRVMECRSEQGRYYLRGVSLGVYEDNQWKAIPQTEYLAQTFSHTPRTHGSGQLLELQIRSILADELLYTPYYWETCPESAQFVDDAYLKNTEHLTEYTVPYHPSEPVIGDLPDGYSAFVQDYYTQIPEDLKLRLTQFMEEEGWSTIDSPVGIAALVRSSGVYDLRTPRLPDGEEFVLYFLQESNRGYCVHFASATVMLLRTVGIPARYVTGYSVSGEPGQWTFVTEDDAHAWVEYYVDGVGWLPLDPTPAADVTEPEPEETPPEEDEEPKPEEQPEDTPPEPDQEQEETPTVPHSAVTAPKKELPRGWLWVLLLPGLILMIGLRRWLLLRSRKKRCTEGAPNERALAMWHWLTSLAKADGEPVEDELRALAEKARYSQHTLTDDELMLLQQALEDRILRIKDNRTAKKLWYQYGLILY